MTADKVNILLVDDQPDNLLALEAVLGDLGQNLVRAESGGEALRCLLDMDVAVVLLDVQMPEMDGFETARMIRAREKTRHTPIVFLTAYSTNDTAVQHGYSLGAVDYVLKPFEPEVIRAKVATFVELDLKSRALQGEIHQRRQAEDAVRGLARSLERRVQERTEELQAVNRSLQQEMRQRQYAEEKREEMLAREEAARIAAEAAVRANEELLHALQASEAQYRLMAEAIPQLVWTAAADGTVDYVNQQWLDFTGSSLSDVRDRGWGPMVDPRDAQSALEKWDDSRRTGETYAAEYRIRRTDGESRWHLVRAVPLRDAAGVIQRWLGTCTDIEDQKRADRAKDEFLAMLGHELRNPLTPIRNALQVLQECAASDPKLARSLSVVDRQVSHMTHLVDDLLDVSRITSGRIHLRQERVDLREIAGTAAEATRSVVEARQHEFDVKLPPAPVWVDADSTRIEQVITNLLHNAAKYTHPGGGIELIVREETEKPAPAKEKAGSLAARGGAVAAAAIVCVRDTGVGIAPDMLPRVFELFTQAERSLDRSEGGLGLGLTLVRTLVELHGGSVRAHSDGVGKGSEFVVRLPLAGAPAPHEDDSGSPPLPAGARSPMNGRSSAAIQETHAGDGGIPQQQSELSLEPRRVLIVEDNPDAAETLSDLLQLWGHEVRVMPDGRVAADAAIEFRPHVVLLDIGLPGMDGYEVARQIRAAEKQMLADCQGSRSRDRPSKPHPIALIAVTGYGQEDDRRRSRDAGFDRHLTKPLDPEALRAILAGEDSALKPQ